MRQGKVIADFVSRASTSKTRYYEPFCGGLGSVFNVAGRCEGLDIRLSDTSLPLITTWHAVMSGWNPPEQFSELQYKQVRDRVEGLYVHESQSSRWLTAA